MTLERLLLVEYEKLKDEQRGRIQHRDNLIYTTIAAASAVIAAAIAARTLALALLLPPVCVLLGWTYLANDAMVSAAGRYIRDQLAPRLAEPSGAAELVFGWETAHRTGPRRRARKVMQLVVDLLAFCIAPMTALVAFWTDGPTAAELVAVSVAEAALLAALAVFMVLDADLCRTAGRQPAGRSRADTR